MSSPVADAAFTPSELIASVRAARSAADAAEVEVLQLAIAWAHAHPVLPGQDWWRAPRATAFSDGSLDPAECTEDELEWFGIPEVRWDAPAAFRSSQRDVHDRGSGADPGRVDPAAPVAPVVRVGACREGSGVAGPAGRPGRDRETSRRDGPHRAELADRAGRIGVAGIDRVLDEAMPRLYPEERELAQLEALDARHATLDEATLNEGGIGEMVLRGTWPDLKDFDHALAEVAAALGREAAARNEVVEGLGVRRLRAVGILADPAAALALLQADPDWAGKAARRRVLLVVHPTGRVLRWRPCDRGGGR
ncbi:MAG: hypothetical protein LH468_12450 [Nocardioides sp.]|nr:hypothetical protein [Nocardioides sp.]